MADHKIIVFTYYLVSKLIYKIQSDSLKRLHWIFKYNFPIYFITLFMFHVAAIMFVSRLYLLMRQSRFQRSLSLNALVKIGLTPPRGVRLGTFFKGNIVI